MEENKTYEIGDIVSATVTGIQNYGAFVLLKNGTQGLIHISEISSRFVRNIHDYLSVGKEVKVKIIEIDPRTNYARLSLKQVGERERQVIRKPPVLKKKRVMIPEDELDFKPLADHLEEWIENSLNKRG